MKRRYCKLLTFNQKSFAVYITINSPKDLDGYHYNLELRTSERISGNEFCALRRYLEEEGYVDDALEFYGTKTLYSE